MTGKRSSNQDDERLAQLLREIDPAHGVAPLPEHRIEDIMTSIITPPTTEPSRDPVGRRTSRRRLDIAVGLASAAAAAVIVTAVLLAQPSPRTAVVLALPDPGVSSLCAPIAAEFIIESDIAFEGRVTGIDGSTVTLEVLHQYTGEPASTVQIPQGTDELSEITIGPLETGGTYLISAIDGRVVACGMSGPSTPELKAVYEEAFS